MVKLVKILTIIISLGLIGSAVAGTLYHFDRTKVDISVHKKFVASTKVQFLEQHRRYVQQRVWELQARYPNTYSQMIEYQRLVEELRQIDMRIRAFYQKRGG